MPKRDERPPGDEHNVTPEGVDEPPPRPPEDEQCWPFRINRPTQHIAEVTVGTAVAGTPRHPDIVVSASGLGVIGFAPERDARLIFRRLESEPSTSTLAGQVDSVSADKVEVTLCLWR